MPKGFLDRVNKITVAIGGIGALVTALAALYAPLEKYKVVPQPYASYVLWAIAAVFIFVVLRAAILAVPLRSVLRDPDAFVLRRELPEHLVGRTDDIDRLEHKLNEASLLFVEGESGVGKSALLRAGLALKLKAGHRYLPVYVESLAGRDWVEGPWRAVIPAFRAALDDRAPPPNRKPVAEAFHELLEAAREAGRTPVLIIDQFDDYQLSHAALFLRAGTWLRAAELAAENPFWAALYAALDGSRLQLVITTRNDMASGLEAARFIEPLPYRVEKVAPQYLRDLIERLSGTASGTSGAIDEPLATWPDLRARLLDDLASGGAILPQQLKVALLGLQGLPRQQLTTAAYMAVGGVRGLEANWIETQIDRATRKSKLSTSDILRLLVALCEPDAVAKTRDLSLPALCEVAGLEDHAAVATALTALEEGEVVRRLARMDSNESLWRLDHDYIAGVVDLANRRANRWELTLAEGRRAFVGASGVVRKWDALLPLKTQIRFFVDRAKGRFRYESGRAYALISLTRVAPAILAVLLVAPGYHAIQTNTADRELAARVSAGFDTDSKLSEKEIKNLTDLSLSNMSVARGVIRQMLDDPNLTENFVAHLRPIMAALYLAADGDWAALAETAEPFAKKASESKKAPIFYVYAMLLDRANRASEATTLLVAAMDANKDNVDALSGLAVSLGAIGDRAPREIAGLVANRLVAAMEANQGNSDALAELARGLGAIGDRVPQETLGLAASRLVAAIVESPDDHDVASALVHGLGAIGDRVPQETAGRVASSLVAAMEAKTNSAFGILPLSILSDSLSAIGRRVPQKIAGELATRLVAAIEPKIKDSFTFDPLIHGLRAIGDQVPEKTAGELATRFVAAMEANKGNGYQLYKFAVGLGTIGRRVPQDTAGPLATRLVAAMEASKGNVNALAALAQGLGAIRDRVPQGIAGKLATRLAAAMEAIQGDADALSGLAIGLGAIGDWVPQETASQLATHLVTAMETNQGNSNMILRLATGVGAIGDRVPHETAGLAASRLVAAMEANHGNTNALSKLAGDLGAIANRVPQETAGQLATRLVTAMEANKSDAYALSGLAGGLSAIGDRVPKVNAQSIAGRLDTLLPRCAITAECHVARIDLHSVVSRERAIQLAFLAGRDPLNAGNTSTIVKRLGRLTGSHFEDRANFDAAEAWLQKNHTMSGVDDASIRKELRDLMRKREAISSAKATAGAGIL
jgi:hypothetical protein